MKRYYITTPIYYVNSSPHIGHAYTTCVADYIARFKRLLGYRVHFLTGTDEHGQKIERAAISANLEPQAFTDQVVQSFINLAKVFNIQYDDFIRTSETRHKNYVQKVWQKLQDRGEIYLGRYAGWYAVRDEAFYNEDELVDGKAPTGAEVEWLEEESYFFRLSKWQDKLLEFYDKNPEFILPLSRRNEVISFVQSGLKDLSVSRTSFSWGIPVPTDEKHTIYVWLDALFNYLSAIEGAELIYWPCNLHLVGKDILRFHAVYWPAFLLALDIEPPKRIFAHGWWKSNGQKMSKSLGNVLDPIALVEKFGSDYMRYFMLREITFGNDGNFSEESMINRINAELVNNIGNLAQRVISFVNQYCDSTIPILSNMQSFAMLPQPDADLLRLAYTAVERMEKEIAVQRINESIGIILELSTRTNEYIAHNQFWELRKSDPTRMHDVLYILLEVIRIIGIILQPITPIAAKSLLDQLNIKDRSMARVLTNKIQSQTKIQAAVPIFDRLL